jgi:hypothetical protein
MDYKKFTYRQKIKFIFSFLILTQISCESLTYVPIKTPLEKDKERKIELMQELKNDFESNGFKYKPLGFGESDVLKPNSHFVLDSLYEIKYKNDLNGINSKAIDEQIQIQKNIIYSDTTPIYFIENHVFSLEKEKNFECLHSEIFLDANNKIYAIKILESISTEHRLSEFYASYKFRKSFIYSNALADLAEIEFYNFYQQKIDQLTLKEKENFINFMLSVMRTAKIISSLDKKVLIKEFVRHFVQGQTKNYLEEKFNKMEEFYDEKNNLLYYLVDYQYSKRNEEKLTEILNVQVYLNPYLQLIEIIPL